MKPIIYTIIGICVVTFTFQSCKKETPDTETQSAVDNNICEGEFNSRMPVINDFAIKQQGIKSPTSAGPTISILPADTIANPNFPRTLVIDYGTTGILDSIDGKIRKGRIEAKFDRRWNMLGATVIVKLINYSVSSNGGSSFMTYAADSAMIKRNSATSFTFDVINGRCSTPEWNLEWATSRTLTQTAGASTPNDNTDDVFEVAGFSNGKDRKGKTYTVNIVSPIVKRATCAWIESGRLNLTPQGLATRTIDYGNGTCDNKASITIDGNTFTFNMN